MLSNWLHNLHLSLSKQATRFPSETSRPPQSCLTTTNPRQWRLCAFPVFLLGFTSQDFLLPATWMTLRGRGRSCSTQPCSRGWSANRGRVMRGERKKMRERRATAMRKRRIQKSPWKTQGTDGFSSFDRCPGPGSLWLCSTSRNGSLIVDQEPMELVSWIMRWRGVHVCADMWCKDLCYVC